MKLAGAVLNTKVMYSEKGKVEMKEAEEFQRQKYRTETSKTELDPSAKSGRKENSIQTKKLEKGAQSFLAESKEAQNTTKKGMESIQCEEEIIAQSEGGNSLDAETFDDKLNGTTDDSRGTNGLYGIQRNDRKDKNHLKSKTCQKSDSRVITLLGPIGAKSILERILEYLPKEDQKAVSEYDLKPENPDNPALLIILKLEKAEKHSSKRTEGPDSTGMTQEGLTWRENKKAILEEGAASLADSPCASMNDGNQHHRSPEPDRLRLPTNRSRRPSPNGTDVSELTMSAHGVWPLASPRRWKRKGAIPTEPLTKVPHLDKEVPWPEQWERERNFPFEDFHIGTGDRYDVRKEMLARKQMLMLTITWNQQAKPGPSAEELKEKLLPPNRYHLISVGTQECENGFAKSLVVPSKKNWESVLQEALGKNYFKVCGQPLQTSHLIIFAHKALRHWISAVSSSVVATGVGNRLGNKGGIGIRICLGTTQLLVVNSHLAAHQGKWDERNAQFNRIANDLHRTFTGKPVQPDKIPLIDEFDLVVWMGDLNYRINSTREVVDTCLEKNMHQVLLQYDELRQCMDRGSCFVGYLEGPLNFRPTYKFDKGSDTYDSSPKMRIPSWTDRILYKQNGEMKLLSYKSIPDLRTSDHRPVCASFVCPLQGLSDVNYPAVYQASVQSQIRRQSLQQQKTNKSEVCVIQ